MIFLYFSHSPSPNIETKCNENVDIALKDEEKFKIKSLREALLHDLSDDDDNSRKKCLFDPRKF